MSRRLAVVFTKVRSSGSSWATTFYKTRRGAAWMSSTSISERSRPMRYRPYTRRPKSLDIRVPRRPGVRRLTQAQADGAAAQDADGGVVGAQHAAPYTAAERRSHLRSIPHTHRDAESSRRTPLDFRGRFVRVEYRAAQHAADAQRAGERSGEGPFQGGSRLGGHARAAVAIHAPQLEGGPRLEPHVGAGPEARQTEGDLRCNLPERCEVVLHDRQARLLAGDSRLGVQQGERHPCGPQFAVQAQLDRRGAIRPDGGAGRVPGGASQASDPDHGRDPPLRRHRARNDKTG